MNKIGIQDRDGTYLRDFLKKHPILKNKIIFKEHPDFKYSYLVNGVQEIGASEAYFNISRIKFIIAGREINSVGLDDVFELVKDTDVKDEMIFHLDELRNLLIK